MMSAWSVPVPAICNVYGTSPSYWLWVRYLKLHGTSPVETVTVPAGPIQIRACHHIDVYADINKKSLVLCSGLH